MEDFDLALLRQSVDVTDTEGPRQSGGSAHMLVFCSLCCKSAKHAQLLECDHVACPAKYHIDCLRNAMQQLHEQYTDEVILCPVCHKFESAAKKYATSGLVAVDEHGRARMNVTLATSTSITHAQERRIKQILQGTAIDMTIEEQIEYLSGHILPRTEELPITM